MPSLHRAWTAAQGAGIFTVGHREACAVTTTADAVDQWRHGAPAVLRAESDDPGRRGAAIVFTAALDVLINTPGLPDPHFGDALDGVLDRLPLREQMAVPYTFRRGLLPESGAAELLAECGAIDPTTGRHSRAWLTADGNRPRIRNSPPESRTAGAGPGDSGHSHIASTSPSSSGPSLSRCRSSCTATSSTATGRNQHPNTVTSGNTTPGHSSTPAAR